MTNPEIFLSYAWGGESENIVNELDFAFQQKGIVLVRDKRDITFKGNISAFMQRIGEGKAIIAVISDKYLQSPYCMFELLEIYRNLNFQDRIFPIVLDDAKIYDPLSKLKYFDYWKTRKNQLDEAIRNNGADAITVIGKDYEVYRKIFSNYGDIVNVLSEINSLTPEMHRADNFITVIEKVLKLTVLSKASPINAVEPVNWKFILKTLREQKCILFLGPELFRSKDNSMSNQEAFFEQLAIENRGKILSYNKEGFFLFSKPEERVNISLKLIDFFENQYDEDLMQKIAKIPFHTIISINPDSALKKYFLQNNQPHSFEFYDKRVKKDILEKPTSKKPLIYNLFGSVIDLETLLLTHDDLFEYFKGLLGNIPLPHGLRIELELAQDYIFLGFQFDKWYVQLILCLLKLHDNNYHFVRYAFANSLSEQTTSFCTNHFKIQFVNSDNRKFIDTLYEKCRQAEMLRDFSKDLKTDLADERLNELRQKIYRGRKLLDDFEKKVEREKDPIKIMDYDDEIAFIKEEITKNERSLGLIYP